MVPVCPQIRTIRGFPLQQNFQIPSELQRGQILVLQNLLDVSETFITFVKKVCLLDPCACDFASSRSIPKKTIEFS